MWTIQISNNEGGVANVTATFTDQDTNFSWNSTIKVGDTDNFVQRAKDGLAKYQELHKDDNSLKTTLENQLNK